MSQPFSDDPEAGPQTYHVVGSPSEVRTSPYKKLAIVAVIVAIAAGVAVGVTMAGGSSSAPAATTGDGVDSFEAGMEVEEELDYEEGALIGDEEELLQETEQSLNDAVDVQTEEFIDNVKNEFGDTLSAQDYADLEEEVDEELKYEEDELLEEVTDSELSKLLQTLTDIDATEYATLDNQAKVDLLKSAIQEQGDFDVKTLQYEIAKQANSQLDDLDFDAQTLEKDELQTMLKKKLGETVDVKLTKSAVTVDQSVLDELTESP